MRSFIVCILLIFSTSLFLKAQETAGYGIEHTVDSLTKRIDFLSKKINDAGASRDASYYARKRDLDMTMFLLDYEQLIYDEDLSQALRLIEIKIKQSEKRSDEYAVNYYEDHKKNLVKLRQEKQIHYNNLFKKEKIFYKEYKEYIDPGTQEAYDRTLRMLSLAIKYAQEKKRNQTLVYLKKYYNQTKALIIDLNNDYDLKELTKKESNFRKVYNPLLESDSLDIIQEGKACVDACYDYASLADTKLDSIYFFKQKLVIANAIADWSERQGISAELASLTGQAIIARRDSLNKEGIYQWNDMILVIGSLNFDSKSESIKKGEAIIDADKTLYKYMRVNKITKNDKKFDLGQTFLLPIKDKDRVSYFRYDNEKMAWQYIVAYSYIIDEKFTEEMGRFLQPLQFKDSISELPE